MYCRRTLQKSAQGEKWELIEHFIAKRPDNVSDGLCADCLRKNYPGK